MNVPIGTRLAEERGRLGLNQEEFADLGGVAPRAYWNYEKGKVAPDADFFARLSEKGIDIMYVITGSRALVLLEAKTTYQTPAHDLAGKIAGMTLSREDADLVLAVASRLNGAASASARDEAAGRTRMDIPATAEGARPPHTIERTRKPKARARGGAD